VIFDVDDSLVANSDAWRHARDLTRGQDAAQGACAQAAPGGLPPTAEKERTP
jgi:hypothetical protein